MPATTRARTQSLRGRLRIAESAWLMPACVLLVLAGLFGMHGLSDHGMAAGGDHAMSSETAAPVAAARHATHVASASPRGSAMAMEHVMSHRDGMGHTGGLCLAILTGLLLGLAAWLSGQRRRPLFEKRFRVAPLPGPRGRDPDPPTPARLGMARC